VHLASFPDGEGRRDEPLERAMDAVRRLVTLARAARQGHFRVRQPLRRMQVAVPEAVRGPEFAELLDVLQAEVNVKDVVVAQSDAEPDQLTRRPLWAPNAAGRSRHGTARRGGVAPPRGRRNGRCHF
jgi:hypothetical protein